MKKILSLVLVLMLCIGMFAIAEEPEATVEPTAVPSSPSHDPGRTPDPTEPPSNPPTGGDDEPEPEATEEPAEEEPVAVEIEEVEGAEVETASEEEINDLIESLENPAVIFAANPEILSLISDKPVLGATIMTIRFVDLVPGQGVTLNMGIPAEFKLVEGDKVITIIGVKDAYGEYTYVAVECVVKDGKLEMPLDADLCQAIQNSDNTQMMFFQA